MLARRIFGLFRIMVLLQVALTGLLFWGLWIFMERFVYVDGFDQLSLNDKTLIYHLSQAAVAGRDIYIDQRYRHSLNIRGVLEAILTHSDGIQEDTVTAIRKYMTLFWVNNGPHSSLTAQKNLLECSPQELRVAVEKAIDNGAKMPVKPADLKGLLDKLEPVFFDAEYETT